MKSGQKIAVIGTGISGLGAAYLLSQRHTVTLYESQSTPGGHARSVTTDVGQGPLVVDTGFIVFNRRNYPLLSGLFDHLQVPVAKSDMSFGVSVDHGWLEYGTRRPYHLFSQLENATRPEYWRMLRDIFRFNRLAPRYLEASLEISLGHALDEMDMGPWFRHYYLLAMGGAIWSLPLTQVYAFPARPFIQFFKNHGLLTVLDHPQWHTVRGGSQVYVRTLLDAFPHTLKLSTAVTSVRRTGAGVEIIDERGGQAEYDHVVLACHSDQALRLMDAPTPDEARILGAIRYQPNVMILHTDTSFMPQRKAAWSSWNYLSEHRARSTYEGQQAVCLSYWMNNLQPLPTKTPILVTLNPSRRPAPETILDQHQFAHPVFTREALMAQEDMNMIQGRDRLWFAGAWQGYGFHEDGLKSAVDLARRFGVTPPWQPEAEKGPASPTAG